MIVRLHVSRRARIVALIAAAGLLVALLLLVVPRWFAPKPIEPPAEAAQAVTRKIKATLYYVSLEGTRLVPVDREVPFGEGPIEQAKRILEAQVAAPPPGVVSAVPAGTALRALYLAEGGEAYVDLTREVADAHPGGSLNENLTVYTIVEALTTNLPAIASVHLLVDGREVDTLAGHVDLRRPIRPNSDWITHDTR